MCLVPSNLLTSTALATKDTAGGGGGAPLSGEIERRQTVMVLNILVSKVS
jgi:hypothetical protein